MSHITNKLAFGLGIQQRCRRYIPPNGFKIMRDVPGAKAEVNDLRSAWKAHTEAWVNGTEPKPDVHRQLFVDINSRLGNPVSTGYSQAALDELFTERLHDYYANNGIGQTQPMSIYFSDDHSLAFFAPTNDNNTHEITGAETSEVRDFEGNIRPYDIYSIQPFYNLKSGIRGFASNGAVFINEEAIRDEVGEEYIGMHNDFNNGTSFPNEVLVHNLDLFDALQNSTYLNHFLASPGQDFKAILFSLFKLGYQDGKSLDEIQREYRDVVIAHEAQHVNDIDLKIPPQVTNIVLKATYEECRSRASELSTNPTIRLGKMMRKMLSYNMLSELRSDNVPTVGNTLADAFLLRHIVDNPELYGLTVLDSNLVSKRAQVYGQLYKLKDNPERFRKVVENLVSDPNVFFNTLLQYNANGKLIQNLSPGCQIR